MSHTLYFFINKISNSVLHTQYFFYYQKSFFYNIFKESTFLEIINMFHMFKIFFRNLTKNKNFHKDFHPLLWESFSTKLNWKISHKNVSFLRIFFKFITPNMIIQFSQLNILIQLKIFCIQNTILRMISYYYILSIYWHKW